MQFLEQHDLPHGVMVRVARSVWDEETEGWEDGRKEDWACDRRLGRRTKVRLLAEARRLAPECFDAGQADASMADASGGSGADDEGSTDGFEQTSRQRRRARKKPRRSGRGRVAAAAADAPRQPPDLPLPPPSPWHGWQAPGVWDVLLDGDGGGDGAVPPPREPPGGSGDPAARGGGGGP